MKDPNLHCKTQVSSTVGEEGWTQVVEWVGLLNKTEDEEVMYSENVERASRPLLFSGLGPPQLASDFS